jgi:hypothetical protein
MIAEVAREAEAWLVVVGREAAPLVGRLACPVLVVP